MAQLRYKYKDPIRGLTLGFSASKHHHAIDFFTSKGVTNWWPVGQTTVKAIDAMPVHIPTDIDDYEGAHEKNRAELEATPIEKRPALIAKFTKEATTKTLSKTSLLSKTGKTRVYILIGVILLIITLISKKLLK